MGRSEDGALEKAPVRAGPIGLLQVVPLGIVELDLQGQERVLQLLGPARAYDGCRHAALREQPGDRHPGGGDPALLAQLDDAFVAVSTRAEPIEELHAAVNQVARNLRFALYRDFPDPQRTRSAERF